MASPVPVPINYFELDGGKWESNRGDLESYISTAQNTPSFVFATSNQLQNNDHRSVELQGKLGRFYGAPDEIWTKLHWESNGFFGCNDNDSYEAAHQTWFRFLIKQLYKCKKEDSRVSSDYYSYGWHKIGFFTTWSKDGHKSILCLDCPDELVAHIGKALTSLPSGAFNTCPYSFHSTIIRGVINLFDTSIWSIRDIIREVEKSREEAIKENAQDAEFDYSRLHEISRHVNHSTETLTVSTEVASRIAQRQKDRISLLEDATREERLRMSQVQDKLTFYYGMLNAFKCRSESMEARQQSETSVAYNTVAQNHSFVAVMDAKIMKVIAALTAVFLPATFVSAVFSMSFFNNGGYLEDGTSDWTLSDKFWIYWAISIPLTIVTIILLSLQDRILEKYNSFKRLSKKKLSRVSE